MKYHTKFTKWYYRKGYRMEYEPVDYADGVGRLTYICPWWVRPLASWLFSPSVYYHEVLGVDE